MSQLHRKSRSINITMQLMCTLSSKIEQIFLEVGEKNGKNSTSRQHYFLNALCCQQNRASLNINLYPTSKYIQLSVRCLPAIRYLYQSITPLPSCTSKGKIKHVVPRRTPGRSRIGHGHEHVLNLARREEKEDE
jgi:hypothetical protein